MAVISNTISCKGCHVAIYFKKSNGQNKAYDSAGLHKCAEYEELRRIGSETNVIESTRTFIAIGNSVLKRYRLRLVIEER